MICKVLAWLTSVCGCPSACAGPDMELQLFGTVRSGRWPKVRADFLKVFPGCAVCGKTEGVVPHHAIPVHVDDSRELDQSNLVALCPDHHLTFGHLCLWYSYNPDVRADAKAWREKIENRP